MISFLRSSRAMLPCALVALAIAAPATPAAAAEAPAVPVCIETGVLPEVGTCPEPTTQGSSVPLPTRGGCANADLRPTRSNAPRIRAATLCLLNKERSKRGLRKLRSQRTLATVARRYASAMVRQRFFAHVSPSGSTMLSRIRATSYLRGSVRRWSVGENLAWGSGQLATPRSIMRSWMNSAGHRANILDRDFREIGIGLANGAPSPGTGDGATYVTEFGLRVR